MGLPHNDMQKLQAMQMQKCQQQGALAQSLGGMQQGLSAYQQLLGGIQIASPPAPAPKRLAPLPIEELICATGGIVAWRSWRVHCFEDQLYSFNGTVWPVRQALRAKCANGVGCTGNACTCGIYSWMKREKLKVNESGHSAIDGEVWLWGKVIEHEFGYRSEYAYPKAFADSVDARRIGKIYGVPVIT